ncbi:non-ribosomal peptide synthase (yersiniabactin siderophore biosynthetic protein) [Escherichia coli]|uniref:Non-ribosomal peptide synthase (Yersiniabactin siderophore biosynthetic protein) n=1 Tax=Escherichia coli TaxID=562 RepID=A0A484X6K1_ECOLX|nr:non-ribosomal peptide synthase (yersiniabactin siderophore biosynthetic protein) [Escherichia coli]
MPDEHELTQLALPLPEQAQLDELEATWRWLEARALQGIAATLNRHGLFTTPEIAHRFSAVVQALSAQASHQRLLRQWLQCLTEREWLIREGESWRCRIPLSEIPEPQEAWPAKPMEPGAGAVSGNLHRPARRPLLRAVFLRWNCCSTSSIALPTRCIATTPPAPV